MMANAADLVVLIADPAGFSSEVFRIKHEVVLSELLNEALLHYMRNPG